ncbi:MAG TPA: 2-phosphosulfolactate phosphatase [Bacteroidota bacterium]|nr:2-phosphosulfolactate phosphatase [Bacteroidota bacterium]
MTVREGTAVIDCFPESVRRYREGYAVVSIDVIRATTTAVTAVARGRRCFPVPSIEMAVPLAARLDHPLLVGELGGNMPYGFDMNNSPAEIDHRDDIMRPMILLSSSGTQLIHNATDCDAAYVACLRNYAATVAHLVDRHKHVAIIGAGTRGEFREEDQMCCAWIAEGLIHAGYKAEDEKTVEIVRRWSGAPPDACAKGNSAEYLRKSGQVRDLDFILGHVNDLDSAFMMKHGEVTRIPISE